MNFYKIILAGFFTIATTYNSFSQDTTKYLAPMDIPMELSANFAEVRINRFHSGIDLRTNGRQGYAVRAVADGYISRIGVKPTGFGRVIYIAHPNAKTTVYAHLRKFTPEIEEFVNNERYRLSSNSLNTFLKHDKFPIKAGQIVGYSGNSGISYGPHLHFELRQSSSQRAIDPVSGCRFNIPDKVPPKFLNAYYITTDTIADTPVHSLPQRILLDKVTPSTFTATDTTAITVSKNGYLLVQVADEKDGNKFNTAVRSIVQKVDSDTTLTVGVSGYLYAQTRYASAMTYYPLQRNSRYDIYTLAIMQGNHLPVYGKVKNRGVINVAPGQRRTVEVVLTDDNGLQSTLSLNLIGNTKPPQPPITPSPMIIVRHNKPFTYSSNGATIQIPISGLFESIFYTQAIDSSEIHNTNGVAILSPAHVIHNPDTPINRSATLHITAEIPGKLQPHASLAVISKNGRLYYAGGHYNEGGVRGSISAFGKYCIVADTIPPEVNVSFRRGANLQNKKEIVFTIKDNFSGIGTTKAYIDGKWVILEKDILNSTVTHIFDNKRMPVTGQNHDIVLEVTDRCGNKTTFTTLFMR